MITTRLTRLFVWLEFTALSPTVPKRGQADEGGTWKPNEQGATSEQ